MDRNIGARDTDYAWAEGGNSGSGVLHYQFGRKDPFPAPTTADATESNGISTAYHGTGSTRLTFANTAAGQVTTATAVQNPLVYYTISSNWCSEAQDITYLWNDTQAELASDKKSIFDPSPAGWKLPTVTADSSAGSSWFGASSSLSNNVYTMFVNAKFPIHAVRSTSGANLVGTTTNSYHWNATPSGATNGRNTSHATNPMPYNSSTRAYGMNIRPVLE